MSASFAKVVVCTALVGTAGSLILNRLPEQILVAIRDVPGVRLWASLEGAGLVDLFLSVAMISLVGLFLATQFGVDVGQGAQGVGNAAGGGALDGILGQLGVAQ